MDFKLIFEEIKKNLKDLVGERVADFKTEGKKDIDAFLKKSEDKLKRWTELLATGGLTLDDYKWLVESQKDLVTLEALYQAGVSKIKLGHLKNSIINTIVNTVIGMVI